ncbi:ABC transporter ATP-binding protein [Halothermothrix orenii]|uniref:ABC transporter related n=1 Tax=Halothermothrix orenii (strain H 168 / OCM 544 / DSM 9562) TaxID=373903 RepID=B8D052_HALOH|nr:sn-glycerol-3-phosphate ABC transporter ATP-binding protein UgpC [Halothermothrix orenii]ACL68806.1 ABC transporter related [Halothermothrix orenii H 168]
MASVTLENVVKRFDDVVAVNNANLEIRDKEFLVLVGPSGCGKSTTLRMIAGLEEITEGTIKIGDTVVNDVPPKDRDIAMVFQNYALYPHMDVYNNMAFSLKLRKFPKDEIDRRVKEAARILGIEDLLDRKPKQLSGGQRQRVALGRAIVREPKVFLMDEPLSNLDAKLRVQMRTELSKLHDRLQTTVIYVTHDQVEAMTMGDRIVVLRDGVIQQVDDPLTLYNKPNNMFVAGFIGSPAMNFLDCKLVKEGDKYYLDGHGSFKIAIPEDKINEAPEIKEYEGREVVFGIRPEDLVDASIKHDFDVTDDNSFTANVEVVEPMGSEIYLYLGINDHSMIARVEAESTAQVGDNVKLGVDTRKMHVFDAETEEAIF